MNLSLMVLCLAFAASPSSSTVTDAFSNSKTLSNSKKERPDVHSTTECWYDEQRLDHFTYKKDDQRWKQRYLLYQEYWMEGRRAGPIFLYGMFP